MQESVKTEFRSQVKSPVLRLIIGAASSVRSIWIGFGAILFLLLLLEFSSQLLFQIKLALFGSSYEGWCELVMNSDSYRNEEWPEEYCVQHKKTSMRWQSYLYWQRAPVHSSHINVDEEGRRKTTNVELDPNCPSPDRLFVFGGSAIWGPGTRDRGTVPSHLARYLHTNGRDCAVVSNFGEQGYVSTQQVISLMRQIQAGNVPDVVILYGAINDLLATYQNGQVGLPQNEINRRLEFNMLNDKDRVRSVFFKNTLQPEGITRLINAIKKLVHTENSGQIISTPLISLDEDTRKRLISETLSVYKANIDLVAALSQSYGFEVYFFWQPNIFSKRKLSNYELRWRQDADQNFVDLLRLYYSRAREDVELVGNQRFVNISGLFDDTATPYFLDTFHLTEDGNELVAEAIGRVVLRQRTVVSE